MSQTKRATPEPAPTRSIAIIGAGPRGAGVLERLAASQGELWGHDRPLVVHLVDPFPPGAGKIWRHNQSPLLKLNSLAADVTMFTDESSTIDGPVRPGPSLSEWAAGVRAGSIQIPVVDELLAAEIDRLGGGSFPTRRLQSLYLDWFYREALGGLGRNVRVEVHQAAASRIHDLDDGGQLVVLDSGRRITVDLVLYSLGHNGARPSPEHQDLVDFAARHGLYYLPPAFTADADTEAIRPGQTVIVRGFGLAAVDLTVLLTEGRGGHFARNAAGSLVYAPSGLEPRLVIGSRRGVPYHSKISSALLGEAPEARFFTPAVAAELERASARLDFSTDVWPLIAQDMLWGYYRELFTAHPDRVRLGWSDFADRLALLDPRALLVATSSPAIDGEANEHVARFCALVTETVIDPVDHLFLPDFDRPLRGLSFGSTEDLQKELRRYIRRDLTLRTREEHSATLGLFLSLLTSLFTLSNIIDSPKWTARSRVRDIHGWWIGYFSYVASGPPGHRLEELLALSEAGVVEFLGGDIRIETSESDGTFRAGGSARGHTVTATALVDARLPDASLAHSDNALLRSLVATGVGVEDVASDGDFTGGTGLLTVRRSDKRVLGPSGAPHPRRFAIGPYTNSPFVGAFSRPRTNAIAFRENDRVARALLVRLHELADAGGDVSVPSTLVRPSDQERKLR